MNKNNQATILHVGVVREIAVFLCQHDARKGEDRSRVSKLFRDTFYGRNACALACFMYNDFGLRSEPPLGSTGVREYSRFFLSPRFREKILHIYVDELGDVGPLDPKSPIYLISLVFADQNLDKTKGLGYFRRIEERYGSGAFLHVGNLIRGEEPYQGFLRDRRRKLLWAFLSYAAGLDFKYANALVEKAKIFSVESLADSLRRSLIRIFDENVTFFASYDLLVVHYDGGQKLCTQTLQKAFLARFNRVLFEKTLQYDDVLMQVADLLCVLGNLEYKLTHGNLSHSEEALLGKGRAIKKEILGRFKRKRL